MLILQKVFGWIVIVGIAKFTLALVGFVSGAMSMSAGYGSIAGENTAIATAIIVAGFVPYVILRMINSRKERS
jgi:multisubunit Na+/H+ antiporter MnhE subunit